ncbi:MAG: protein kinase [Verrucomicrobiales bacterium]|nr:protein kinase [Verrucomicrobiales bacterium]
MPRAESDREVEPTFQAGIPFASGGTAADRQTLEQADTIGAAAPAAVSPNLGHDFGGYRILGVLGRGGMGEVYEAEHRESGRRVALKVMKHALGSEVDRKRFLREGRLAASINHPNVVYIYGSEEIDGVPAISMELVAGGNLHQWVKCQGPLSVIEAVEAILQIIDGLEAASAAGVLHRDIKPSNCFRAVDGTVKIGDFGLSISTLAHSESLITARGTPLGTPSFASPEQLRGEDLDMRSDIYSVGATLYYLLTGKPPFAAGDLVKLIAEVLSKAPPSPDRLRPDIPRSLAKLIMRCLAKDRSARYADYGNLRRALLPFGSTALDPATLGFRFMAGLMDLLIITVISASVMAFAGPKTWDTQLDALRSLSGLISLLGSLAIQILYFAILEWRWGASPAKMLFNLRVSDCFGRPMGFGRAIHRSCWFLIPPAILQTACYVLIPSQPEFLQQSALSLSFLLWVASLAVTMRRNNGYAEIHDLLSGTRVTRRLTPFTASRIALDRRAEPIGTPVSVPPVAKRIGPYAIIASLGRCADEEFLLGYDQVLRRKVWIHCLPAGAPPVLPRRQNLARSGRLHWLTGKRTTSECWDAYEARDGQFLLKLPNRSRPWANVRLWLHDLAEEYHAGLKDNSLPPVVDLDRVWITVDSRALLLDFTFPGAEEVRASSRAALNAPSLEAMQGFLDRVVAVALQSSPARAVGVAAKHSPIPGPLHAHSFLRNLHERAFQSADALVGNLRSLLGKQAIISRERRSAMVLTCLFFIFLPGVFRVLPLWSFFGDGQGRTAIKSFSGTSQSGMALMAFLRELSANRAAPLQRSDAQWLEAFEICIANRAEPVINNAAWLEYYSPVVPKDALKMLKDIVAKHQQTTPERLDEAMALLFERGSFSIKKWLETWRSEEAKSANDRRTFTLKRVIRFATHLLSESIGPAVLFVIFPSLLLSVACRGGLLLHGFDLDIVKSDGSRASRLRILWRTFLVWTLPATAWILDLASYWVWSPFVLLEFLLLAAFFTGGAYAIWQPNRAWQDYLAGTHLVPK